MIRQARSRRLHRPVHFFESRLLAVRILSLILSFALACAAPSAFAAHPLQTEDTGTQGTANIEIENGFSRASTDGATLTTYQPQVSVGLATTIDAIVQPSLLWQRGPDGKASGLGDTNFDAKWRFWGSDPLSLAVRAGVLAPTSQHELGLPRGDYSEHALLVATWDDTPTTVHANVGATYVPPAPASPARRVLGHLSAAVMQTINEHLILTVDGDIDQDPSPRRSAWPGSLLAGAIWTARPGLDLDIGYQRSFDATTVTRTWLAGVTYRFSL